MQTTSFLALGKAEFLHGYYYPVCKHEKCNNFTCLAYKRSHSFINVWCHNFKCCL